jgi:hypothetical protein
METSIFLASVLAASILGAVLTWLLLRRRQHAYLAGTDEIVHSLQASYRKALEQSSLNPHHSKQGHERELTV